MQITFITKDNGSGSGNCAAIMATDSAPTRYALNDRPGYLVQGVTLTGVELDAAAAVGAANDAAMADHESIVWVPADVIDQHTEATT